MCANIIPSTLVLGRVLFVPVAVLPCACRIFSRFCFCRVGRLCTGCFLNEGDLDWARCRCSSTPFLVAMPTMCNTFLAAKQQQSQTISGRFPIMCWVHTPIYARAHTFWPIWLFMFLPTAGSGLIVLILCSFGKAWEPGHARSSTQQCMNRPECGFCPNRAPSNFVRDFSHL